MLAHQLRVDSAEKEKEKVCIIFHQMDSGVEMGFTWSLCLTGSAALGLILLVWGVFELDYSIVGLGYCLALTRQCVWGLVCVCVLGFCVHVCVLPHHRIS